MEGESNESNWSLCRIHIVHYYQSYTLWIFVQIRSPHGIAIFIEATTDNINRTVASVRSIFTKNNGSLGTNGSLSFIFDAKGKAWLL